MRIQNRILRFIEDELLEGKPAGADPLRAGLLDSMAIEQLVAHLEDEYGVVFYDDDLVTENFASLGTLAALVDRKRREAS